MNQEQQQRYDELISRGFSPEEAERIVFFLGPDIIEVNADGDVIPYSIPPFSESVKSSLSSSKKGNN